MPRVRQGWTPEVVWGGRGWDCGHVYLRYASVSVGQCVCVRVRVFVRVRVRVCVYVRMRVCARVCGLIHLFVICIDEF